ncbi:hypothetical protein [Zavarzinia sp.]|uniref:hypothetical protein n=1 Tax=Zavarzinia sp. TaxID=2027920 RepID=UPI0035616499
MSFSRRDFALLGLSAALAGCSSTGQSRLGRLFGRRDRPAQSLLPPPSQGQDDTILPGLPVLVPPTQDLSAKDDGRAFHLAAALVKQLVAADVLATMRNAASQSYILATRVEGETVVAELARPDGMAAGKWRVPLGQPAATIDGAALEALAARIAGAVLGGTAPAPAPEAPHLAANPTIVVAPVTGAPGDGNKALRSAISRALAVAGLKVVDKPAADSLSVAGKVAVTPIDARRQHVVLTWSVSNVKGELIATIAQENDVPVGSLDHSWGPIAGAAAQGGADGVLQLVQALRGR